MQKPCFFTIVFSFSTGSGITDDINIDSLLVISPTSLERSSMFVRVMWRRI